MIDQCGMFDFRTSGWGHALHDVEVRDHELPRSFMDRLLRRKPQSVRYLSCFGHSTPLPWEGTILLTRMQSGKTGKWRVVRCTYAGDPRDMFTIHRADFEGYLEDEEVVTDE